MKEEEFPRLAHTVARARHGAIGGPLYELEAHRMTTTNLRHEEERTTWPYGQSEAKDVHYADGRAAERADIVAWLRAPGSELHAAADEIERGEHRHDNNLR
jgi:hypothetical protein